MINAERFAHAEGLDDRVQLGAEELPEGVYAGDAAKSLIPEIQWACDPRSENFGGFFSDALQGTRERVAAARKLEVEAALETDLSDEEEEELLEELDKLELYGVYAIPQDQIKEPDADLLAEQMEKKEMLLARIKGHADVSLLTNTIQQGMAIFVAITPEGDRCIYGIGPEQVVNNYLQRARYHVNSNFIGGPNDRLGSRETTTRPAIPSPFDLYSNLTLDGRYAGPLEPDGSYIDVTQLVGLLYEPES